MKTLFDHDYKSEDEVTVTLQLNAKDIDSGVDIDEVVEAITTNERIKNVDYAASDYDYAQLVLTVASGVDKKEVRAAMKQAYKAVK